MNRKFNFSFKTVWESLQHFFSHIVLSLFMIRRIFFFFFLNLRYKNIFVNWQGSWHCFENQSTLTAGKDNSSGYGMGLGVHKTVNVHKRQK